MYTQVTVGSLPATALVKLGRPGAGRDHQEL